MLRDGGTAHRKTLGQFAHGPGPQGQTLEHPTTGGVRYGGEGATCVLALRRENATRVLAVRDDGVGVAVDDLPRLFERFYRADQARASRGSGLGLAIVKHVVEAAGGQVEALGAPAEGLEIRAAFPA